jgi:DNA primase
MLDQSVIDQVCSKKSIIGYLEEKGHKPFKVLTGGKFAYLCPFPDHNETKPSFIVWTNSEHENFHCFGCQRGFSIVHLVAGLESISFKDALERLCEGLEVSLEDSVMYSTALSAKAANEKDTQLGYIADRLTVISSLCRTYLESVDNDPNEQCIIDRLYRQVDSELANFELDKIDDTAAYLPEILQRRREKFEQLKLEELARSYERARDDRAQRGESAGVVRREDETPVHNHQLFSSPSCLC